MSIKKAVSEYLDEHNVEYQTISHEQVFSTVEEAKELGIEADEIAKTLVISTRDKQALVVIPGGQRIDVKKLREVMNSSHARLMTEEEMSENFPQFDIGAIPPIGELFGLPVYIDKRLLDRDNIIFSGGTHTDSIKMKVKDLAELTKGQTVDIVRQKTFEATAW